MFGLCALASTCIWPHLRSIQFGILVPESFRTFVLPALGKFARCRPAHPFHVYQDQALSNDRPQYENNRCVKQVAFFASQQPARLIIASPPAGVPLSAVLSQALSSFLGLPPAAPFDALLGPLLASPQLPVAESGTADSGPEWVADFSSQSQLPAAETSSAAHRGAVDGQQMPASQVRSLF